MTTHDLKVRKGEKVRDAVTVEQGGEKLGQFITPVIIPGCIFAFGISLVGAGCMP